MGSWRVYEGICARFAHFCIRKGTLGPIHALIFTRLPGAPRASHGLARVERLFARLAADAAPVRGGGGDSLHQRKEGRTTDVNRTIRTPSRGAPDRLRRREQPDRTIRNEMRDHARGSERALDRQ